MDDTRYAAEVMPHLPTLIRTAATLVGPAYAEDAAQEALVRAWQAWPDLADDAQVRPWLLRIVANVCLDWQRGRFGTHQRMRDMTAMEDDLAQTLLGGDPGSSDHAAALDVREAVGALDTTLQRIVTLRYYVGLDSAEIGATLGMPAATVRTRLRRALTLLRDHLNAHPSPSREAADV